MATQTDNELLADFLGEGITTNDGSSLGRDLSFNAQCFLIQHMAHIARGVEHRSQAGPMEPKTVELVRDWPDDHQSFASGYRFISPVLSDADYPPAAQFSKLCSEGDSAAQALLNLTPAQQAQLVPKIRLYKVEYETNPVTLRPDLTTGKDIEIIFDDYVSEQTLSRMYSEQTGRVRGAGIQSFTWDLKGVNPAEIDANITATLDIHFNSVDSLMYDNNRAQQRAAGQEGVASFLDLIIFAPSEVLPTSGDLGSSTAGVADSDDNAVEAAYLYDGKFFELKAVVGWQVPAMPGMAGWGDITEELQDALRDTQVVLYLQLTDHQFKFEQDGSVDLSISYRARLTSREPEYDLLRVGSMQTDKRIATLEKQLEAKGRVVDAAEDNTNWFTNNRLTDQGQALDRAQAEYTRVEEELEAERQSLNDELESRYSWILDQLIDGGPHNPGRKLFNAWARPVQLRALTVYNQDVPADPSSGAPAAPGQMTAGGATMEGMYRLLTDSNVEETVVSGAPIGQTGSDSIDDYENTPGVDIDVVVGNAHSGRAFMEYGLRTDGAGAVRLDKWGFFDAPAVTMYGEAQTGGNYIANPDQEMRNWTSLTGQAGDAADKIARSAPSSVQGVTQNRLSDALHDEQLQEDSLVMQSTLGAAASAGFRGPSGVNASRTMAGLGNIRAWERKPSEWDKVQAEGDSASYPVSFFLLGDLLDIVIGRFGSQRDMNKRGVHWDIKNGSLAFATADLEFFNFKTFYATAAQFPGGGPDVFFKKLRFRSLSFSPSDRKKFYQRVNLASIPIQYDRFLDWYIQKIVKSRRRSYFLYDFISDILREVVAPALSAQCFFGLPQTQFQATVGDIMTDSNSELSAQLGWDAANSSTGRAANSSGVTFTSTMGQLVRKGALPATFTPYLRRDSFVPPLASGHEVHRNVKVIYATTIKPTDMAGLYAQDFESGIYHYVIGADRGLLKRVIFNRMDAPFLKEARVDRDRSLGPQQLRELYSVSLRLYGNALVKPGQYIYLEAPPVGFGNVRKGGSSPSLARSLGIGGYHLVTAVHSVIDRNGYETSLTALHEALPLPVGQDVQLVAVMEDFTSGGS